MKNEKGIAHLFLILLLAGVMIVGGGFYFLSKTFGNNNPKLTDSQLQDVAEARASSEDLAALIEAARGMIHDPEGMDEIIDAVIKERKSQIKEQAEKILAKNTCDVLMIDIENALKLASDAWLATDDETGAALWEWAREAYRGFVVDAALAVGSTFMEQGIDLFALSPEERSALYQQSREKFYDRALLAQQAQLFGFEDIHDKILRGDFLEPVCVQLWNIKVEMLYDHGDGFSIETHWTSGTELRDIPIYKYHPKMGLPIFYKNSIEKGYFTVREMWWSDDSYDAPYYAQVGGNVYWTIEMAYKEGVNDFWNDTITIKADPNAPGTELVIDWTDGQSGPFMDIHYYKDQFKVEIPTLLLWKKQPVQYSTGGNIDSSENSNGSIKYSINMTPTKSVKINELK